MKTRLQLQGELQKADSNAPRVYRNVFDVFRKTWQHEGVRGLQRGLLPAVRRGVLVEAADWVDSMGTRYLIGPFCQFC